MSSRLFATLALIGALLVVGFLPLPDATSQAEPDHNWPIGDPAPALR